MAPMASPSATGAARPRSPFADGLRDVAALAPGVLVFGLSFGALVRDRGIDPIAGGASSVIIGAGAGQTGAIEVLAVGGAVAVAVLTALVINARFALYSAALAPMFSRFTRRWRWGLAYLVADQTVALHTRGEERWPDPADQQRYMLGITLPMRGSWILGSVAGLLLGPIIPAAWQLGVIVPLMFISLAVPNVRGASTAAALIVGGAAVLVFRDLPHGLNLIAGALAGMATGMAIPERTKRADADAPVGGAA